MTDSSWHLRWHRSGPQWAAKGLAAAEACVRGRHFLELAESIKTLATLQHQARRAGSNL
jgi:hypothetical protein